MLTQSQQKFLIKMLQRKLTKQNNGVYDSRAFYRIVSYLRRNGLIQSSRNTENIFEYRLTIKGSLLARLLASFDDNDDIIREKFGLM